MAGDRNYNLFCPKCRKRASAAHLMFVRYSVYRLELPLLLCTDCGLICVDRQTLCAAIEEWRKRSASAMDVPLRELCKEFMGEMEKSAKNYWIAQLGYKKARFLKSIAT